MNLGDKTVNPLLPKLLLQQPPDQQEAFAFGYNSVIDGANEKNCHFSIFMCEENTRAWERGAAEGKRFIATAEKKRS